MITKGYHWRLIACWVMTEVILRIIRQGDVVIYAGETKMKKETNWVRQIVILLIDERGVPAFEEKHCFQNR